MTRGVFSITGSLSSYEKTAKVWYVGLEQYDCFWYDLIVNSPDHSKFDESISSYLSHLKQEVENSLEKRFIYFICLRPKIRFDVRRRPRYELFGESLIVYLLVGRKEVRKKIRVKLYDPLSGVLCKPRCEITDKFIMMHFQSGPVVCPLHDFIRVNGVNLGLATEVHYVGLTKNPNTRPINRKHRRLADTLYIVSNEDSDLFIIVNLFRVYSFASDKEGGMFYLFSNAMIDEVNVDDEGSLIEKSLIAYFNSTIQEECLSGDRARLKRKMRSLRKIQNIERVLIDFHADVDNEYLNLCSRDVKPSNRHIFWCIPASDGAVIEPLPSTYDVAKFLDQMAGLGSHA